MRNHGVAPPPPQCGKKTTQMVKTPFPIFGGHFVGGSHNSTVGGNGDF